MDASGTQIDRIDINYEEAIWLQRKGETVVGMAKTILFADVISGLLVCGIVDVNAKPGADTKDALFEAIIPWALSKEAKMIQVTNKEYTILRQIERALIKIEEGSYGICDITKKEIPKARLDALPYASMTVQAQEEMEKGLL